MSDAFGQPDRATPMTHGEFADYSDAMETRLTERREMYAQELRDALGRVVHHLALWLGLLFVIVLGSLALGALNVAENHDAIQEIQQSRLQRCLADNARHRGTVRKLHQEIAAVVAHTPRAHRAATAARLLTNERFTDALIEQIVPLQNCYAAVTPPRISGSG